MRSRIVVVGLLTVGGIIGLASHLVAQKKDGEVPKEVQNLAGTYTGVWTLNGINDKGEVVKKSAWTDKVTADNPQIKDDRAFVTMTDEMLFEGQAQPIKVQVKEGYILNKDGSLGDYFIETGGQTNRAIKLAENVNSYAAPANDLGSLGFPRDAVGQHVLARVVLMEKGVETHRITRLTTVSWKDKEGNEQAMQFVSLQGFHKKAKP